LCFSLHPRYSKSRRPYLELFRRIATGALLTLPLLNPFFLFSDRRALLSVENGLELQFHVCTRLPPRGGAVSLLFRNPFHSFFCWRSFPFPFPARSWTSDGWQSYFLPPAIPTRPFFIVTNVRSARPNSTFLCTGVRAEVSLRARLTTSISLLFFFSRGPSPFSTSEMHSQRSLRLPHPPDDLSRDVSSFQDVVHPCPLPNLVHDTRRPFPFF